jgi:hypothetical protein
LQGADRQRLAHRSAEKCLGVQVILEGFAQACGPPSA